MKLKFTIDNEVKEYRKISQIIIGRNILYNLYHYRVYFYKEPVIDIWLEFKIDIDIDDYLYYDKNINDYSWIKKDEVNLENSKIIEWSIGLE